MTTIVAFSVENVCGLTGLTPRQLQYWDRAGFFPPRYFVEDQRSSRNRLYDFRAVVGLRTLALLRYKFNIHVSTLRQVGSRLAAWQDETWSGLHLYVSGGTVMFEAPPAGNGRFPVLGRTVFAVELGEIEREVSGAAERLKERMPEEIGQVVRKRGVLHNKPVLAGTRIPTTAVWHFHEDGYDTEAIREAYPSLTPLDIEAAIAYEQARRTPRAS